MKSKSLIIRALKSFPFFGLFSSFLFSVVFLSPLKAQTPVEPEWELVQETAGVKFYYHIETCGEQTTMFLRINNNSGTTVAGNWVLDIDTGQGDIQYLGSIMPLNVDEEIVATCNNPEPSLFFPINLIDTSSLKVMINATIETLQ